MNSFYSKMKNIFKYFVALCSHLRMIKKYTHLPTWKWLSLVLLGINLLACETDSTSQWVQKVLYNDKQILRINYLFHHLQEIKTIETLPLKYEDEAGLSYQLNIDPNVYAEISYYKNIEDTTHKIIAFSADIHFTQDKQAIETYKSFESTFQKIYGIFDGTFGNQEWVVPDLNYRINMKLLNQKKEILITCSSIQ